MERYTSGSVQYYTASLFYIQENAVRDSGSLSREKAAHREQILMSIGKGLRQEYEAQPVPDRLSDLVKELEQPTGDSRFAQT
jgi:hypothetical protein